MNRELIESIFADAKAVITNDHFVYAKKPDGWYHGREYVNKDAIYPFRRSVKTLCKAIAEEFAYSRPEVVVGPSIGAISLKDGVADYLSSLLDYDVLAVYADEEDILIPGKIEASTLKVHDFTAFGEVSIVHNQYFLDVEYLQKEGTRRVIKRGYNAHVKGKRCFVVDDVINSGSTVQKTIRATEAAGGIVLGVGALCNRSGGKVTAQTLGVPTLFSLLNLNMEMFKEEDCPICKEKGVESVRTDLGKGKEFLARIGQV